MKKILIITCLVIFSSIKIVYSQNAPALKELTEAPEEIEGYNAKEFNEWLEDFKEKARKKYKISQKTLDTAFKNIKYNPKVIKSDRKQPEFMRTFWKYFDSALKPERVADGRIMLKKYKTLLKNVSEKYGVPKEIIVAFWGMETYYGKILGNYNIIDSLTTLAFDPRRTDFFSSELIQALKIIDAGHMKPSQMIGSWAGAFGNFQFLPSTFNRYAVDGDGDGKINLISNISDAMHSAGNYLSKMGWDKKYRWGRPVLIAKDDKKIWEYVNSNEWEPLSFFRSLGVKQLDGNLVANKDIKASLIAPNGVEGPVFIVYNNFKLIMNWNASTNYALSIGLLSDALKTDTIPIFDRPENWDKMQAMSTNQIRQIQEKLASLDIYDSKATGLYGKKTMKAIKKYQKKLLDGDEDVSKTGKEITFYKSGKPVIPDGYPSFDLYEQMFDK